MILKPLLLHAACLCLSNSSALGRWGPGDIFDVALCVLVVRRLRTTREHFKNVVLYPHFQGAEEACSARAKEALSHTPRNLRLQGKDRVQDGQCFAIKNLKDAVLVRDSSWNVCQFRDNLGELRCCERILGSCWLYGLQLCENLESSVSQGFETWCPWRREPRWLGLTGIPTWCSMKREPIHQEIFVFNPT